MREIIAGGLFSLALCGAVLAGPIATEGGIATSNHSVGALREKPFSAAVVPGGLIFTLTNDATRGRSPGEPGSLGAAAGRANQTLEFTSVTLSTTQTFVVIVSNQRPDDALQSHGFGTVRALAYDGRLFAHPIGSSSALNSAGATLLTDDGGALEPANRLYPSDWGTAASARNMAWAGIAVR